MIDRSLDLYKMETGQYRLNPLQFDVSELTRKVVEAGRRNARDSGVAVLFDAPDSCMMLGEELLTFSMLGNLLKNAVEASQRSDRVSVRVCCDNGIVISIHNYGEIPEAIRPRFFEKYVTAGKKSGTGLGTYSAKLMAEVQGGTISFDSTAEAGTTLTVRFPG